jgi:glutaconate CoA-transferase, subunit B
MSESPEGSGAARDEVMTVVAARALRGARTCFVGIGLPSAAANLARRLHAPDLLLVYESGTIGSKPDVLPLSIGDGELAETAVTVVSVPEIFAYWLQAGRIDVGFLGAAQLDPRGNLNTTVIGEWQRPRVRLPGAGGAPEIAAHARTVLVMLPHSRRTFVERLDYVTTPGRPARVITDLGVLEPDPDTGELVLGALHPGVAVEEVREATGWPLRVAPHLERTEPPTRAELEILRDLRKRTRAAHAGGDG